MEGTGMVSGKLAPQEGRKLWQYMATISACLLSLTAGNILSWTSPVLPKLQDKNGWLYLDDEQGSWVGSLMSIGAIIGAVPAGTLADKFGRKRAILAAAVPYLISWLLIILASHAIVLYVARTFSGIGVGLTCVVVPIYIAEIAEPSARGMLGATFQLCVSAGILYGFVFGALVSYTWLAICCGFIDVAFLGTFVFMPESPQWLMGQGRKSDAAKALVVLRGDEYDVTEELAIMQKSAEDTATRKSSMADLVNTCGARTGLVAALGLLTFQQFSGVNAVIFYTVAIFQAAGSSLEPDIASIIVGIVQTMMSVVAALIVNRVGRRVLLMGSSVVLAICLLMLGFYFQLNLTTVGWLPLLSLTIYMVAFSLGFGPVPWMMVGELFPVETKGNASVIAVMVNWSASFIVTKFFTNLRDAFGTGITFWIFTVIMILATVFAFFVVPETRGKSLQQIQDELNGRNRNRVV